MTYEERKRLLCQQCGKQQCGYVNRHIEDKCLAIQEKMEGWELGWQDAIDKAFDFLIERYENQGVILLEDINELKQRMEEQQ